MARLLAVGDVECSSPAGAAVVLDGSASTDPSSPGTEDDLVGYEWLLEFGKPGEALLGIGRNLERILPVGLHEVTLRVTDLFGETSTATGLVRVVDRVAPEMQVSLDPTVLWPPDRRMVEVRAVVGAQDACGEVTVRLASVTAQETGLGVTAGGGPFDDDIAGADAGTADFTFLLRAERLARATNRTYAVTYEATDASGNVSAVTETVLVPHDRRTSLGRLGPRVTPQLPVLGAPP